MLRHVLLAATARALTLAPRRFVLGGASAAAAATVLGPQRARADPAAFLVGGLDTDVNPLASLSRDPMNSNVLFGQDFYFKYGRAAPFLDDATTPLPGEMPFTRVQQRYDAYAKYAGRVVAAVAAFKAVEGEIAAGDWARVDAADP